MLFELYHLLQTTSADVTHMCLDELAPRPHTHTHITPQQQMCVCAYLRCETTTTTTKYLYIYPYHIYMQACSIICMLLYRIVNWHDAYKQVVLIVHCVCLSRWFFFLYLCLICQSMVLSCRADWTNSTDAFSFISLRLLRLLLLLLLSIWLCPPASASAFARYSI